MGLRVGWAWIAPGRSLTRPVAIAAAGRSAVMVALGMVLPLGVSGLVEAFITPLPLPAVVRIAIGAVAWIAFLVYLVVLGHRAARSEESADVAFFERDVIAPMA